MITAVLLLAVSVVLLAVGAECLVRGAARLAMRLGVSSFFIGITIVGFGTSSPELFTGIIAASRDLSAVNIGNVVGSNIFNIAVILGVSSMLCPIPVKVEVVTRQVWVVIAVSLVPYVALVNAGHISWPVGALLLMGLAVFVFDGYRRGRREASDERSAMPQEVGADVPASATTVRRVFFIDLILIVAGLALLVLASGLLIESAVTIARTLGASELVIALTIVAGGTSVPELFTSVVAAFRRQSDMAVGNVLGSNVFNILGVLATAAIISPQQVHHDVLVMHAPMMIVCSVALLPIVLSGRRISRGEGIVLTMAYAAYILIILTRG